MHNFVAIVSQNSCCVHNRLSHIITTLADALVYYRSLHVSQLLAATLRSNHSRRHSTLGGSTVTRRALEKRGKNATPLGVTHTQIVTSTWSKYLITIISRVKYTYTRLNCRSGYSAQMLAGDFKYKYFLFRIPRCKCVYCKGRLHIE